MKEFAKKTTHKLLALQDYGANANLRRLLASRFMEEAKLPASQDVPVNAHRLWQKIARQLPEERPREIRFRDMVGLASALAATAMVFLAVCLHAYKETSHLEGHPQRNPTPAADFTAGDETHQSLRWTPMELSQLVETQSRQNHLRMDSSNCDRARQSCVEQNVL